MNDSTSKQRGVENLVEPPILNEVVEEFPPKGLREAGLTKGGTPVDQPAQPADETVRPDQPAK